jgi:hypothetical protein
MGHVNQHARGVHGTDDLNACGAELAVHWLAGDDVAQLVVAVVH